MTPTAWNERKEAFLNAADEVLLKFKRRRGRRPDTVILLGEIVGNADLRRKLEVMRFVDLESQVHFWSDQT